MIEFGNFFASTSGPFNAAIRKVAALVAAVAIALFAPLAFAQPAAPGAAASTAPTTAAAPVAAAAAAPAPSALPADAERGKLAWYGRKFAGRRTASGEIYNPDALTMAHKTLPFGTRVKVTNLANQKRVMLRVNDRGPTQADRVGDVSLAAARQLGMVRAGVTDAELEVIAAATAKRR